MTLQVYIVRPPHGFTIKDARGFNVAGGAVGRSLSWPLPATTAGAARTAIGDAAGWFANPAAAHWQGLLTDVELSGPLAVARPVGSSEPWTLHMPCPRDAIGFPGRCVWLAPEPRANVRATWHVGRPPEDAATDGLWWPRLASKDKPGPLPVWWPRTAALEWLLAPADGPAPVSGPVPDGRVDMHLAIDSERLTAQPGKLFGLETQETLVKRGSAFEEIGFRVRISRESQDEALPSPTSAPWVWRFGGEARVAEATPTSEDPWAFPTRDFEERWRPSRRFRLLVASPACFSHGWRPDGFEVQGDPPVFVRAFALPGGELRATLRAAYVSRPTPVSGWDFVSRAPKASRLLVPQGSVYYLEADRDVTVDDMRALWLATLQLPNSQDARDGFGLVIPGAWPEHPPTPQPKR